MFQLQKETKLSNAPSFFGKVPNIFFFFGTRRDQNLEHAGTKTWNTPGRPGTFLAGSKFREICFNRTFYQLE
mgnify:CR=1 FL=1